MADDQVKYSDLFESGIDAQVKALTEEIKALRDAISAAKDEAQGMKKELSSMGTATREQQQAVSTQAAAIEKLQKQAKDLTEQEAKAVKFLADSLNFMNQNGTKNMNVWKNMTQSMDGFNMSYNQMKETVKVLESALKSLNGEQQRNSEGAKSAAAAVARLKEAMQAFDAQTKTAKGNVEKTSRAYAKLTDEEIQSLNQLKTALKGTAQEQIAAVQAIDIQAKSYNELYQTYNAIKDVLNAMTVAERENTEEGKMMVNRAKEIRDTLNNLQQQTGNYTLNVGNYMSAMNGLQMQTQQILREIPSAQNLSQFFLAISNNIPMFTDALARYNKGLPEIKAKLAAVTAEITRQEAALAGMNAQSTEYAAKQAQINELRRQEQQLQSASVGGWRAILKSVGSWQTLLIAGLLILRKIPTWVKAISEKIKEWRHGVQLVNNEMNTMTAKAQVYSDVLKKTNDEIVKLDMVVERLKTIDKGTQEWKDAVAMVNDITKQNLDAVKTTKEEIEKVTEAYKEQAIQIATNDIIAEKIAKSRAQKALVKAAMEADTLEAAMDLAGIKPDTKEGKKFIKAWSDYNTTRQAMNYKPSDDWMKLPEIQSDLQVPDTPVHIEPPKVGDNERNKVENIVRAQYQDMIDEETEKILQQMIKPVKPLKKENTPKGTGAGLSFNDSYTGVTMADILVAEANAMQDKGDNVLQTIELWYAKKSAIARASYEKDIETLNKEEKQKKETLKENLLNAKLFVAKYDETVAKLDAQHAAGAMEDDEWNAQKNKLANQLNEANALIKKAATERQNIEKYYGTQRKIAEQKRDNELLDLQAEYNKKKSDEQEKADKKDAKNRLKAAVDGWAQYKAKLVEEGKTRKQIVEAEVAAEIARLKLMLNLNRDVNGEIMSDEQKAKVQEWINLLERLQQTGNYGDYKPGQFMGKGGANVTNDKKSYSSAMQVIADVLDVDVTSEQISALNNVFDQAKEALNSWMDARKAAADQAKELADDEVSAAENALNREIELRNQGYANDVALREKELADAKAAQKKAVEEQKKIAKEQVLLDAALQTSSLLTASANIMKQFPNPALWIPMLGILWGTFGYAKIKSYQAAEKSIKFKEGGVMLLEGGSHESGHDVNLGIGPDGSNLRAEGGEYFAVINKRSSRKYGSQIPAVVNALNSGMFEDRYIKTSDAVGLLPQVIRADNGTTVDLSSLEGGVDALVKQGEQNWTIEGGYRVLRYKNLTRRVKIG